jgi:hypothetical protein
MAKAQGKKSAARAHKRPAKKVIARVARAKAKVKRVAKKAVKAVKKPLPKPAKPAAREAPKAKLAAKAVVKPPVAAHKAGAKPGAKPLPVPPRPAPAAEKKRSRRSRPRVQSSGTISATWFAQGERPRPSSFIPAPPRAEAPSLVAAPPASSDRLVADHELTEFAVRTVPVRVDLDASGGRVFLGANPDEVILKVGEGIEWDFRYIAGADVIVDEVIIEFEKPSPFPQSTFKSRRPGTARPHRQLSGAVHKNAAGKRIRYTIRAMNTFKSEMATARLWVTVTA